MQKLIHKSKFQENILWIVWTLIIFQTPTKFDLKCGMYLSMMIQQYRGDQSRGSIIKYENLSDYKNLWMIIHIDVYLFVTSYKKKISLIKIHFVLFLRSILLFFLTSHYSLVLSSSYSFILQQNKNYFYIKFKIPIIYFICYYF